MRIIYMLKCAEICARKKVPVADAPWGPFSVRAHEECLHACLLHAYTRGENNANVGLSHTHMYSPRVRDDSTGRCAAQGAKFAHAIFFYPRVCMYNAFLRR